MSDNPKYMAVTLGASAQAEVAAQQRAREEAWHSAKAKVQRDRMTQRQRQLDNRLAMLADRLGALVDDARRAGADAAVQDLRDRSADVTDRRGRVDDQAAFAVLAGEVGRLEREAGRLAKSVADSLALDGSKEALIAVRDALNAAPYRTVFDPEGTREVNSHLSGALAAAAHDTDFPDAFSALTERVVAHLETVVENRAAIEEACVLADEALATLDLVLEQARTEGIPLTGADAALELARRIDVVRDRPWPGTELLQALRLDVDALTETGRALAGELEERLVRTARAEQVARAAAAALPSAGFKVITGSTVRDGDRVMLGAVQKRDASILDLEIAPAADGTVAIVYHSEGGDSDSGLDRLQAELEKHDLAVGELRCNGKPDDAADAVQPGLSQRSKESGN